MVKNERNAFFDMLKGAAIILVILTHFEFTEEEKLGYFYPFWVNMAVPLFMIISGYLYAKSYKKNRIFSLGQAYEFSFVLKKILRFTLPYLVVLALELVLENVFFGQRMSLLNMAAFAISGGIGPGSYYYPLMIQFIFVFPCIYFIVRKKPNGLFLCFLLNMAFELMQWAYGMGVDCYRLLLFRYIFAIAAGCFLGLEKYSFKKAMLLCFFLFGAAYIYYVCYTDYEAQVMTHWTKTSFLSTFYILPIFVLLKGLFYERKNAFLALLGRASYHIYFAQMLVFQYLDINIISKRISNDFLHVAVTLALCIITGLIFYKVETPVGTYISKKICRYFEKPHIPQTKTIYDFFYRKAG